MTPQKIAQNIIAYVDGGTYYEHYKDGTVWRTRAKNMSYLLLAAALPFFTLKTRTFKLPIFLNYAAKNSIEVIPLSQVEGYRYDGKACERLRK